MFHFLFSFRGSHSDFQKALKKRLSPQLDDKPFLFLYTYALALSQ